MQTVEFNEWDFLPVNLKPNEIVDPLIVLDDFFREDWLPGHLERLKEWRKYVLADDYYHGYKNSPAELLYFYHANLKLVEAMHLMKEKVASSALAVGANQLESEKQTWRDFPFNLTEIELLQPVQVISHFFEVYNLPQYRAFLYDWLEYGLSSSGSKEFIEAVDLIAVYENLQKLYSAAWLIIQRSSGNHYLKVQGVQILNDSKTIFTPPVSLYPLNTALQNDNSQKFSELITVIKHKVASVQAIICLGTEPVDGLLFLLVLTANEEQKLAQALSSTIEESCLPIAKVVALVHHADKLFNAVSDNDRFFNHALTCPVVYLSGSLLLPQKTSQPNNGDITIEQWGRWHKQATDFFNGAEYYLKIEAYGASLFSLHQCAECLLVAIIRAVLGYRINNHNLSKLLSITKMFTPDIAGVFDLDNSEQLRLFTCLKNAYVNVRYKDDFEIDEKSVNDLFKLIEKFALIAELVYKKHVLSNSL